MRLALKSVVAGCALAALVHAGFWLFGTAFFVDGRSPFQINFAAGAAAGLAAGLFAPALIGAPTGERLRALALMLVPFLIVEAAVTSHFHVFFRDLNPVMDKVYGALMLWGAAFALLGGLVRR